MSVKQIVKFEADDGKLFDTEHEVEKYNTKLKFDSLYSEHPMVDHNRSLQPLPSYVVFHWLRQNLTPELVDMFVQLQARV